MTASFLQASLFTSVVAFGVDTAGRRRRRVVGTAGEDVGAEIEMAHRARGVAFHQQPGAY